MGMETPPHAVLDPAAPESESAMGERLLRLASGLGPGLGPAPELGTEAPPRAVLQAPAIPELVSALVEDPLGPALGVV